MVSIIVWRSFRFTCLLTELHIDKQKRCIEIQRQLMKAKPYNPEQRQTIKNLSAKTNRQTPKKFTKSALSHPTCTKASRESFDSA